MKRLFTLFMFAFVAMSCEDNQNFIDDEGYGLVFIEGEMKACFDDKGDTLNYKFNADLAWSAEVSADWVEVDPTSGPAGENKIQIKVNKNKSNEKRTGYVDITLSNDKSYRIELEQLAMGENLGDVTPSASILNNEIWYTSADGNIVEPYSAAYHYREDIIYSVFGANIVSNTFEAEKECWVIKFDGDVTTIGDYAFASCDNLTSVTFPDSVSTIGRCAFYDCSSLARFNGKYVSEDNRCLIFDGTLTSFAPAGLVEYTIPDSVTTIGWNAFFRCSSLTSITIGDSVTTIDFNAFCLCNSLISITIPDSVTTIGSCAFYDCTSLKSVTIGNSVTLIGSYAFNGCNSLTSITIPDSVTTIDDSAFCYCKSLTSITIPDSVTTISDYAFAFCDSLTSVTIGDGVTTIGASAFRGCSSLREFNGKYASDNGRCLIIDGTLNSFAPAGLTEYTIPDSVTRIGDSVFRDYHSLTSVIIPDSVTTIGDSVFHDCHSLTSVYCRATTPPTAILYDTYWYAFYSNDSSRKIYVPTGSVDAYKSAAGWSDYADAIIGYDF